MKKQKKACQIGTIRMFNKEQKDEWSVAWKADSSAKAGNMTKITLQKPDFVNTNEV